MSQLEHQIQQKELELLNDNLSPYEYTEPEVEELTDHDRETQSILAGSGFRAFFDTETMSINYNDSVKSEVDEYLTAERSKTKKSETYDLVHSIFASKLTEVKAYSIRRPKLKSLDAINAIIEANTALKDSAIEKLKTHPDDTESIDIIDKFNHAVDLSNSLTKFLLVFMYKLEELVKIGKHEVARDLAEKGSKIDFVELGKLTDEQKYTLLSQYMGAIDEHLK